MKDVTLFTNTAYKPGDLVSLTLRGKRWLRQEDNRTLREAWRNIIEKDQRHEPKMMLLNRPFGYVITGGLLNAYVPVLVGKRAITLNFIVRVDLQGQKLQDLDPLEKIFTKLPEEKNV